MSGKKYVEDSHERNCGQWMIDRGRKEGERESEIGGSNDLHR